MHEPLKAPLHVVTVNYHRADLTARAVSGVLAGCDDSVRVIVIDNESDGSWRREAAAADPRVHSIVNERNVGFGAACNQGFEHALREGSRGVLLLNNDAVPQPGAPALLEIAAARDGLAAPKILLPDGRIYSAGGIVEMWAGRCRNRGIYETDDGRYDEAGRLRFASACALYVARGALEAGLRFHEPYFLYYEDAEFCLCAERAGFAVRYEPLAVVYHLESASTGPTGRHRLAYYDARNRMLFLRRNARGAAGMAARAVTGLILRFKRAAARLRGEHETARAIGRGLRDYNAGRFGAMSRD